MKETIAFEDYIKPKTKKSGWFGKKDKIIDRPIETQKELSDIEKLENEIEEKKRQIEIKKLEENLKKNEALLKEAESKSSINIEEIEVSQNLSSSPQNNLQEINLSFEDTKKIKKCPKCNKKLFKNKVIQKKDHLAQILKCKSSTCDFYKELKYNI